MRHDVGPWAFRHRSVILNIVRFASLSKVSIRFKFKPEIVCVALSGTF